MRKVKKVYIPSTTEIKILDTVKLLNDNDEYPLPLGVFKILSGSTDPEFEKYQELATYKTLTSYTSKHISRLIMMLLRNDYLYKIYDENSDELYLSLSDKGQVFLFDYHKKHKYKFVRKTPSKKPLIVKISKK